MTLFESLLNHRASGRAILAVNFYNAETLLAVLQAARRNQVPVLLQTSPSTLQYLGIPMAVAMVRSAAKDLGVQAWLHLDHATDGALIERCLGAGYDSVMIDASESSFERNVELTRKTVQAAHSCGILVEAELGYIPKLGQVDAHESGFTSPADARRFVEATGVDLLAVAIGTAHGFYQKEPNLDLDRLSAIRSVVDIPLVLHGGSGVPPDQWKEAIRRGITKINLATEVKDAFMQGIKCAITGTQEIDIRKVFPPAIEAVTRLVAAKMKLCN